MTRRLLPYGGSAVLVECTDLDDALGLLATLRLADHDQIEEIIPGAQTLLVRLSGRLTRPLAQFLLEAPATPPAAAGGEPVIIEVDYSGADLSEVGELVGLTQRQVVAAHTGQLWRVAFSGFAPGFGYLIGENDTLRVPRRASPRTRVPAGALGLADHWSGIYPQEGPGGWQLIGTTRSRLWDLERDPPALLQPGDRVRFVETC